MVIGAVLYPYVYLSCRSMFLMQGRQAAVVARTLGASPLTVFFRVQLPMVAAGHRNRPHPGRARNAERHRRGEYLGVPTLTFAIYDAWLNRGNLAGAAQIAVAMLALVAVADHGRAHARRRQRFVTA